MRTARHLGHLAFARILISASAMLVLSLAASDLRAAGPPRVALVPSTQSAAPEEVLRELSGTIARALSEAGIELVPVGTLQANGCQGVTECRAQLENLQADFAIEMFARFEAESFAIALSLWDASGEKAIGTEARDCPICDLADFYKAGRQLADSMGARTTTYAKSHPPAPKVSGLVEKPSAMAPASHALSGWTWPLIAGGGATMAAGIALLVVDGNAGGSCDNGARASRMCKELETTTGGILTLGVGTLTTVLGLWSWFQDGEDGVSLSITPNAFLLRGNF